MHQGNQREVIGRVIRMPIMLLTPIRCSYSFRVLGMAHNLGFYAQGIKKSINAAILTDDRADTFDDDVHDIPATIILLQIPVVAGSTCCELFTIRRAQF